MNLGANKVCGCSRVTVSLYLLKIEYQFLAYREHEHSYIISVSCSGYLENYLDRQTALREILEII